MARSSLLMPGLPNDLALQCLLYLPPESLSRMKLVSSLWRIALESDRFYVQRRRQFCYPSLFLVRSLHQRCECLDLDFADLTATRVLFSCGLDVGQTLFPNPSACVSFGNSVVVAGGEGCESLSGTDVRVFNILTRKWTPASEMISSRSQFLYALLDRRLFVLGSDVKAGSISTEADVYDYTMDRWNPIKSPPASFFYDVCFPFQDKLFVRGTQTVDPWLSSAYSFDPSKNQWEEEFGMRDRLKGVITGSKIVATPDGTLLVATLQEDSRHVGLMLQRPRGQWTHVARIPITGRGNIFLFSEFDKIVLLIPTTSRTLECYQPPYFPRLLLISVPCSELLLATLIEGK